MRRLLLLLALLLAAWPVQAQAPRPDTTYTVGLDQPNTAYSHYYALFRRDSIMGFVLNGADSPYAGSCRNVWCALVQTASTSWSQSGGTFGSFSQAAHEVVRVWNLKHPGDTVVTSTPTPVPVDSITPIPEPTPTPIPTPIPTDTTNGGQLAVDTPYTNVRIPCPAGGWVTCYNVVTKSKGVIGSVRQDPNRHWWPYVGNSTTYLPPYATTLKLASQRLVVIAYTPSTPTPVPVDTLHVHYLIVTDTLFLRPGDSVNLQPDSTHIVVPIKVVKPDTVVITKVRVDTVRVPVPTPSDTTGYCADSVVFVDSDFPNTDSNLAAYQHCQYIGRILYSPITTLAVDSTPWLAVPKGHRQTLGRFKSEYLAMQALKPGAPVRTPVELPHMGGMDKMLESAYASDTVTRQVFDLVGKTLVARVDSLGRPMCQNMTRVQTPQGIVEQPQYFPCPPAVVQAVKRRNQATREAQARKATHKEMRP